MANNHRKLGACIEVFPSGDGTFTVQSVQPDHQGGEEFAYVVNTVVERVSKEEASAEATAASFRLGWPTFVLNAAPDA